MQTLTLDSFKTIYQRFLDSGVSVRGFCRAEGLNENRFYYWQAKIRKEAACGTGNFMPVSINNRGGNKYVITGRPTQETSVSVESKCEIVYPNGIVVRLPGSASPEVLRQLIHISC